MKKVFVEILCIILGILLVVTEVLVLQNELSELIMVWKVFFVCWAVCAFYILKELIEALREQLNQNEDKKENNDECN